MNSTVIHERPGVYSSYDASVVISGGGAGKVVGVAAKASKGATDKTVRGARTIRIVRGRTVTEPVPDRTIRTVRVRRTAAETSFRWMCL